MTKQPFTPAGVKQKTAELYALSNLDLDTQSNLVITDFRQWMNNNFTLDSTQQTYLTNLDQGFVNTLARSVSNALNNRVPINLTKAEIPSGASKYIRSRDSITAVWNTNGATVSGELNIDIGAE